MQSIPGSPATAAEETIIRGQVDLVYLGHETYSNYSDLLDRTSIQRITMDTVKVYNQHADEEVKGKVLLLDHIESASTPNRTQEDEQIIQ